MRPAVVVIFAATLALGLASCGDQTSYRGEMETLQIAVDAWRSARQSFPTLQGGEKCLCAIDRDGDPSLPDCNPYLDIGALADAGLLKNASAVKFTDTSKNTTATNRSSGPYGWLLSTGGLVDSFPGFVGAGPCTGAFGF